MRSAGHSATTRGRAPAAHGLLRIGQCATSDPSGPLYRGPYGPVQGVTQHRSAYAARLNYSSSPGRTAASRGWFRHTDSCFSYPAAPVSLHDTSTRSLRVAEYAMVINCSDGTAAILSNRSRRPSGIVMQTETI